MNKSLLFTIDFPPDVGGVANYYWEICSHLPSDKIVVLAPKCVPPLIRGGEGGFKIHRKTLVTNLPIWPKWLPAFWHLYRIVKKEKIKTVLVGQVLPLGTVVLILSKILKFDYIILTHGMDIMEAQKHPRKKKLLLKILKQAKDITANSEFTKNEIIKLGVDKNKIIIIYPCPHIKPPADKNIKREIIQRYNLSDKKIILSVGRLVERKGFDLVIKSMTKIAEKIDNTVYVIAGGGGNYKNEIKKLIKNSPANKNIILVENSSHKEITALYELCDVFIMPSRQIGEDVEGFGIVYLEANSFGKPVIVGRSGGAVEAVIDNKTGLVVNPENEEEISNAIIKLLNDKKLAQKLGGQGKKRVEEEFTWGKQVEKLKSIL